MKTARIAPARTPAAWTQELANTCNQRPEPAIVTEVDSTSAVLTCTKAVADSMKWAAPNTNSMGPMFAFLLMEVRNI